MTATTNQQLGRLTPHQRRVALLALRYLRPTATCDKFVVARAKRTVGRPESSTVRQHSACAVLEVGNAAALDHLAHKGYVQRIVERRSGVEQTFYAATDAGLEWFARQAAA